MGLTDLFEPFITSSTWVRRPCMCYGQGPGVFWLTRRKHTPRYSVLRADRLLCGAQHTDVFIGMHGDGWTDAMFLRGEAVAVHLAPYGWLRAPGSVKPLIRGNFYKTMVVSRPMHCYGMCTRTGHLWVASTEVTAQASMFRGHPDEHAQC